MMINWTIHNMAINDVGFEDDGSTPMNALKKRSIGWSLLIDFDCLGHTYTTRTHEGRSRTQTLLSFLAALEFTAENT